MEMPDGTILMHADHAPYDAAKAHEYYMRTRKLHPRAPGAGTYTVKTASGGTVKLSPKEYAEQSAYAAHRVAQIKANLVKMKADLRKRIFEAKQREHNANKPQTAAEKAKAAEDAKKYRQTHKQELRNKARQRAAKDKKSGSSGATPATDKSKAKGSKTETTADLKYAIHQAQTNLKAAVAKQRALAGATKSG